MTDDQIQHFIATLEQLEAGQEGLCTGLEGLRSGQDNLRAGQESLRAGQDRLRADLMERMDRPQHAIELVRDDVTVNFGSSDNALRIAKGASDEVRGLGEMIGTMRLQTDVEQLRGGGAAG